MQTMLSTHRPSGRRVSRLRGSLRTSVSHIILLVMYQRGTLMTLKQELIQQVSCWLATLYISLLTGWNVDKTLYKHTCGVGNPVHVAQGYTARCVSAACNIMPCCIVCHTLHALQCHPDCIQCCPLFYAYDIVNPFHAGSIIAQSKALSKWSCC